MSFLWAIEKKRNSCWLFFSGNAVYLATMLYWLAHEQLFNYFGSIPGMMETLSLIEPLFRYSSFLGGACIIGFLAMEMRGEQA
ncbi:hypothetical protein QQ054_24300 [Oscillatoria amoena NRMC-F 0135]|nr:hypothetical protein [Oscillatoria amoena NRMC-F 0135]